METRWNGLTCTVASEVATLVSTAGRSEAHPSEMALAAGGIVINLTANLIALFETDAVYTVVIRKET